MKLLHELRRKSFHLFGLVIPTGYYIVPESAGRPVLLGLTVGAILVDVVRLNVPRVRTFFYYLFGKLVRDHERFNLLGSTYLLLSSLLCVYAFDRPIAIVSMAFVTVGDAFAAVVGRTIGRTRVLGKTVEGSLACFVVCLLLAYLYPGDPFTWRMMVGGALAATVFELVPIPLDDNLRMALSAGFAMTLLR